MNKQEKYLLGYLRNIFSGKNYPLFLNSVSKIDYKKKQEFNGSFLEVNNFNCRIFIYASPVGPKLRGIGGGSFVVIVPFAIS